MSSTSSILRRALLYGKSACNQASLIFTDTNSPWFIAEDARQVPRVDCGLRCIRPRGLCDARHEGRSTIKRQETTAAASGDGNQGASCSDQLRGQRASARGSHGRCEQDRSRYDAASTDCVPQLQSPNLDAIVVPKVDSAADLHFVADVIRHAVPERSHRGTATSSRQAPVHVLALIESAKALSALPAICTATPHLAGLIFAAEDFALDLSLTRTPALTEFLYARSAIATAARAHGLASTIDLVCTAFRGADGQAALAEECAGGKGLGFNGKQCIHPAQVGPVQAAFAPSAQELDWAARVAVAAKQADARGRGAWTLDGKMVDAPVVGKARAIVEQARLAGFDVAAAMKRWEAQEPE